MESVFAEIMVKNKLSPDLLIGVLINASAPKILKIKKHFNRPRPWTLAKKFNVKMKDYRLPSMNTPSYPSGHSAQAVLIARVLSDKYPRLKKAFMSAAKKISYSRRVARGHYESDSKFGELIGEDMYKHIKNKVQKKGSN